ncbi:MAG: A/G-specific adenine glycosylase [Brumimicrobium sp.]|nr:A/G-specific adenine glycosylase [Brumimicrobium sp.]
MDDFALSIRFWYRQNSRKLPWRETSDPYFIWLSEIILQQTRVDQGRSYYEKFVRNFPTVEDLAAADEQDVLNLWQGLGYYSRARNLHFAAKQIMNDYKGQFPSDFENIKKLRGVGDYTAAAIASFAFRLPHAVVDGNVYRVLARYYAESTPIDSSAGQKLFREYAQQLLSQDSPDEFNQAIMELGALVCTPSKPSCETCPISENCMAFRRSEQNFYPVKKNKTRVTEKFFNYFLPQGREIQIEQRTGKGIWQNLYQFPLIESDIELDHDQANKASLEKWNTNTIEKKASYTHLLSHQKINAHFWLTEKRITNKGNEREYLTLDLDDIHDYPIPRLIERFLEENIQGSD